ncbi:MAG TPA: carboxypeptidase regulatory-like domain-containing protein, partial [Sphingomicrobium sp.]|nr:carboxypeptidase regulatory-like domain-containing protein [Sphingomicrobium sp.]
MNWRRTGTRVLAVLALAGSAAALPASAPVNDGWTADPDEQYLLDVNIRHLSLGDGVRAYATPQGTCVVFGDFLQALDVPMKIDLQAHKAAGWAFKQENQISIDVAARIATFNRKSESFAATDVREVPEGWCVDTAALARWFAIGINPDRSVSSLTLEAEEKLPVELAMERRGRAASLKRPVSIDLSSIPQVRLPYRMWRAPALEFIVNAGVTYRANGGARVDRSASIYAAGEIAALSYSAAVQTDLGGLPTSVRATLFRSDPDAGLLGPLQATHAAVGDVEGLASAFGGGSGTGRGAVITNRPLSRAATFDRTEFVGELHPGWDAELYRNGALLAFDDGSSSDGRYHFRDVEML